MKVSDVSKEDATQLARIAAYLQSGEFLIKGGEGIRFGAAMHWFSEFLKSVAASQSAPVVPISKAKKDDERS